MYTVYVYLSLFVDPIILWSPRLMAEVCNVDLLEVLERRFLAQPGGALAPMPPLHLKKSPEPKRNHATAGSPRTRTLAWSDDRAEKGASRVAAMRSGRGTCFATLGPNRRYACRSLPWSCKTSKFYGSSSFSSFVLLLAPQSHSPWRPRT